MVFAKRSQVGAPFCGLAAFCETKCLRAAALRTGKRFAKRTPEAEALACRGDFAKRSQFGRGLYFEKKKPLLAI